MRKLRAQEEDKQRLANQEKDRRIKEARKIVANMKRTGISSITKDSICFNGTPKSTGLNDFLSAIATRNNSPSKAMDSASLAAGITLSTVRLSITKSVPAMNKLKH